MIKIISLIFLLTLSTQLFAQPLAKDKLIKLQEIIELFKINSNEKATKTLKSNESMLIEALNQCKDAKAYMLLGRAYFYAAMDSKAKNSLKMALKYDSSLPDAHFFIGLINLYSNNLDSAEKSFRNAIQLNNKNENYFVELGRTLEYKNDTKSALIEYKNALNINKENFSANFYSANIYINQRNHKEAEKLYLTALKLKPNNLSINYNLGQLYQNTKQHNLAIKYFSRVIELDPSDWRAIAKIIQENQAIGKTAERDIAVKKMYKLWVNGESKKLIQQGFYIREQQKIDKGNLFVLEYFELKGEHPRKYVFNVQDPVTRNVVFTVSLGSYNWTTQVSRESGNIGPKDRVYHLDGYAPDGTHITYAFFDSEPEYDTVRSLVFKVFSGTHRPLSSTEPSNSN